MVFTGLVEYVFDIERIDENKLKLHAPENIDFYVKEGDSVSINGVCLTVTANLIFYLSNETLSRACFPDIGKSWKANIELAMPSRYNGHVISGHIHTTGKVVSLIGENLLIDIGLENISKVRFKGSIAIDGVSLTIADVDTEKGYIRLAIIPLTLQKTIISLYQKDTIVNLEFDITVPYKNDEDFMQEALLEAKKGEFTTAPNPWVGCVIVHNNIIIAKGYHVSCGEAHAEVNALALLPSISGDLTLYCTLEPCCHYGRTAPCTDAILKNGNVKKVVIGTLDPDERVNGKGAEILRNKGIVVSVMNDKNVEYEMRHYLYSRRYKIPYITLKIALSLDSCYIDEENTSKWITHEESRKHAHMLRASSQAIIIGKNTKYKDNPHLNVRYDIDIGKRNQPKILVAGKDEINFEQLYKEGVLHCIIEGGKITHEKFCSIAQELVIFRSGCMFGPNAYPWSFKTDLNFECKETRILKDTNGVVNTMERYFIKSTLSSIEENTEKIVFSSIEDAVNIFSKGGFVIIMDDDDREGEGDLVCLASKITEQQMAEMINHTSGIICAPMDQEWANRLMLTPMCIKNTDIRHTSFTVSVDLIPNHSGISAKERVATLNALASKDSTPENFQRPGHIFPLVAHKNGLYGRRGHTEASVALCNLVSENEKVAVIGELKNRDGTIKNKYQCYIYAKNNNIPIITVPQIVKHPLAKCTIKLRYCEKEWNMYVFASSEKEYPHRIISYCIKDESIENIPIRIHSECFTGDVLYSMQCDCGLQLHEAFKYIEQKGRGMIVFPGKHEGRGIGLTNKIRAYNLQKTMSVNTFEANNILGYKDDERIYDDILKDIIVDLTKGRGLELLTENPEKIHFLNEYIKLTIPLKTVVNSYNSNYLELKKLKFSNTKNIAIISTTEWHKSYIQQITDLLKQYLSTKDVLVSEYYVPGAGELPFMANRLATSGNYNGIICVGILMKGETNHDSMVANAVYTGLTQIQIQTSIPIINCVLTCSNYEQVQNRINGPKETLRYVVDSLMTMMSVSI
jgi:3,4-dihydroxy 2-butanone 4-phosphate synthase/GTP cyclohydrolase II